MIKNVAMLSTSPPSRPGRRALLALGAGLALSGCTGSPGDFGRTASAQAQQDGTLLMPDGTGLPFRSWLPADEPSVVALALHGMNDSRDAWEIPAPVLARAGWAVYGPDQRGFGAAPGRGRWAGTDRMVADAAEMARQVAHRHPQARLVLLGESMGAAVLMCLATGGQAPAGARYVLAAPAVWGRATMNIFLRATLWTASTLLPGMTASRSPIKIVASDNRDAILRLSRDPLTLRETRFDAVRGLVDLEDAADAAAPRFTADGLFLYGGHDDLIPQAATAATWRALPRGGARTAFYPGGYHLLLRDLGRAAVLADVITWERAPRAPLPSGADRAAAAWLAGAA
jgi:alpha-beta hydrolase superfamily lysophospholipase